MYLLLKRDIEIFHAAKTNVLHNDELWDAAESLLYVYDAIMLRHRDLAGMLIVCIALSVSLVSDNNVHSIVSAAEIGR